MRNVPKPQLQDLGRDRLNAAELLTINFNRRQKYAIYPT